MSFNFPNPFPSNPPQFPNPFAADKIPRNSQIKPENWHQFVRGFPAPDQIFTQGMQSSFRKQLEAFARANSYEKRGYTGTGPAMIPKPGDHTGGMLGLIPNPNYKRTPIHMKTVTIGTVRKLPPRKVPVSSGGFRKTSRIEAGNMPQPLLSDFNHGAILGYGKPTWIGLDELQRMYAGLQEFLLTIPGLFDQYIGNGMECPDFAALIHGFIKWITSTDVQRPVHIFMKGYSDFVIVVTDAMLKQQTPIRSFFDIFRFWDDPIEARGSAAAKAPSAIQAMNDFCEMLMSPISNAINPNRTPYSYGQ